MTHVMTKPCPICKRQLTKRQPTDTVQCACGKHVWQGLTPAKWKEHGRGKEPAPDFSLWMHFPIVAITLAGVWPLAMVVAIQSIHYKGVCSYPAHLFVEVLAKIGYVENATSIPQVRINQVIPEAFQHR